MSRRWVVLILVTFLAACATSSNGGPRRSSRVITAEEIAETSAITAHDAIRLLRPQWLHTRASPTATSPDGEPPMVYIDGLQQDDFRSMERILAARVQRMEFLSPTDATNRYGTNHRGGAILITTR